MCVFDTWVRALTPRAFPQARAAVLACAVADDCSTLLAALANGCIARWELVVPTDAPAGADDMEAAAE